MRLHDISLLRTSAILHAWSMMVHIRGERDKDSKMPV